MDPYELPSCLPRPFYGSPGPSDKPPGILCSGASEASENCRDQNRGILCCNRGPGVYPTQFLGQTNPNSRHFNADHEYDSCFSLRPINTNLGALLCVKYVSYVFRGNPQFWARLALNRLIATKQAIVILILRTANEDQSLALTLGGKVFSGHVRSRSYDVISFPMHRRK